MDCRYILRHRFGDVDLVDWKTCTAASRAHRVIFGRGAFRG